MPAEPLFMLPLLPIVNAACLSQISRMDDGYRPGQPGMVVWRDPKTGERRLDELVWGLLPHDTQHPETVSRPTFARAETVATNPMFADAFRHRRAIIPATEYRQRQTTGEAGQRRFTISRADGEPMAWAGLWEAYRWPNGRITRTYCVITVPANGLIAPIHDRMPCVLEREDWPMWLGEVEGDPAALLRPAADDVLVSDPPIAPPDNSGRKRGTRSLLAIVGVLAALPLCAPLAACSSLSPSGTACVGLHDATTYNTSGPTEINSGLICP